LADEAERAQCRLDEETAAKLRPRREATEPRARRIVRLVTDPEDTGPQPIISTKRFRDPSAFVRKRLEQLFAAKKDVPRANVDELADVLSWQARGLSAREIAEQLGQTQAWVRWRLDGISKLFIRYGIKDLSPRAQPKIATAAD
jgi:hypothetical protein